MVIPQIKDAVIIKFNINTAIAVATTVRVVARPTPSAVGAALNPSQTANRLATTP
jgi:hypothetical protein